MAVAVCEHLGRGESPWVAPSLLTRFSFSSGVFGRRLNVWNLSCRTLTQCFDLGEDSLPLSVKFLHNPDAAEGYVSCALSGIVYRFYKCEASILPAATGDPAMVSYRVVEKRAEEIWGSREKEGGVWRGQYPDPALDVCARMRGVCSSTECKSPS